MSPHETSAMAWGDPTHKRVFNEESFGYFCSKWDGGINKKSNHYRVHKEYGIECNFEMLSQKVHLDRRSGHIKAILKAIKVKIETRNHLLPHNRESFKLLLEMKDQF